MSTWNFKWDSGYTVALLLCCVMLFAQHMNVVNGTSFSGTNREAIDIDYSALSEITDGENFGEYAKNGAPAVILLVAEWCGYCRAQEKALRQNKIPFKRLDIERSDAGRSLYKKLGGGGIPITIVGKSIIRGFDPSSVITAYNQAIKLNSPNQIGGEDAPDGEVVPNGLAI